MKHLLILIFCFQYWYVDAQSTIKGKVIDEDKKGITNATVNLKIGKKSTTVLADNEGNFILENVKTGINSLLITATSFENFETQINVKENELLDLGPISMLKSSKELQTVEVIGRRTKNYTNEYSFSATKTATLNKDIPQSISTVTKELIADRQAFQLADAVKIVSSVIPTSFYNFYSIRGISQQEEGQIINGMRTRQYFFAQPLTSNIERIEVVKGNAGSTFASSDPGGSINMVTKKPLDIDRKELSVSVGSFNTARSTMDFTGPLNKEKTLLYRLNAAYQEASSYRDLMHQKSILLSPSISYVPNTKTSLNAEFIYSNVDGKLDRGQPIFGAVAGVTNLNSTPIGLNLVASNDYNKSKLIIVMGNFTHKFSENINFNISYMKQTWTEDLLEHRTTNNFAVDIANKPIPTLAAMQTVQRKQFWNVDNIHSYFNFDLKTGAFKHKLLTGYDFNSWQQTIGGGQNAARGYLLNSGATTNSFALANAANYQTITVGGVVMPKPNVPHFDLVNPANTLKNINEYTFTKTAFPAQLTKSDAIYIQDQVYWKKFIVLISLRNEWFQDITNYKTVKAKTVNNAALLPRIGITYSVTKNMNVYGTYLKGFQPQSNAVTLLPIVAPAGTTYAPLEGDLKELGLKTTVFNNKLQVNAAIYEINQRNLLMNANDINNPDLLITRGGARSRGFEADIAGYLLPNWQINASYSYIDAIILDDNNKNLIGKRKENTPVNSANLWSRYNFASGTALKDLGIGLGLQYNGSKYPWLTHDFQTPAYTLLDMALYYSPSKSSMQFSLNVNNVANKTYWIGAFNYLRLFPGAPRNIMLTSTFKF
jgi:iron complex outermembrane recepter protein